jgi:hypothetical protein
VYDATGTLLRAFSTGGDIHDIQTTADGRIWVAYSDVGVGDGAPGLVCFDEHGRTLFGYNSHLSGTTQRTCSDLMRVAAEPLLIVNCYAVNVQSSGATWLYYYNGASTSRCTLARVTDYQVDDVWPLVPDGVFYAFAISADRVLFAGDLNLNNTLVLASRASSTVERLRATDENGKLIEFTSWRCCGKGSRLYLVSQSLVYSVDLDDLRLKA